MTPHCVSWFLQTWLLMFTLSPGNSPIDLCSSSVFLWQKTQLSAKHKRPVMQMIPLSKACLPVSRIKSFRAITWNCDALKQTWVMKTDFYFLTAPSSKNIKKVTQTKRKQKTTISKERSVSSLRKTCAFNKY